MASVNSAQINLSVSLACSDTSNALAPRNVAMTYPVANPPLQIKLAAGAVVGTIDQMFVGQVTVPATSTATLVLSSGLADPSGDALVFVRVVGFIFVNNGAAKVTLGGGSQPLGALTGTDTNTIDLNPGFPVMFGKNDSTGYAVTSGSRDTLTFTNGSGSACVVDVILLGRAE